MIETDPSWLSWCEVSQNALRANVGHIRQRLGSGVRLGIVVKGNAYGHGITACARVFSDCGVDWLIVNSLAEADTLRRAGIDAPIYVCGPILPSQVHMVIETRARVMVADNVLLPAIAMKAQAEGVDVLVHLKLETGTHRQGLCEPDLVRMARQIEHMEFVQLEGLTTHFADIEDTTDHTFAKAQSGALRHARDELRTLGINVPIVHAANSAATLIWPETHGDLVRVGISAYGLWPSRETYATALQRAAEPSGHFSLPELEPALSWRTHITHINLVPAGDYIGYGRTYRATYPMRLAVLPVGYHEGYRRGLSNSAHALVHGVRAPVRGRVCMNMCMVDVTHIPDTDVGDTATLLGAMGDETVSLEQLADWAGTINYEMVSTIHPDLPRLMVD